MRALTPSERRGALVLVLLLALGAAHDLARSLRPVVRDLPPPSPAPASAAPDSAPATAPAALDLNRADAAALAALPGIGPVLAGRIVAHRDIHGPFRRVEDLLAVRGVGPRLLERLRGRVSAPGAR